MQWNVLDVVRPSPMLDGLEDKAWVYFVHSYAPTLDDPEAVVATCEYGGTVVAAVETGNVFATQFHPEKSSTAGLRLLSNFVDRARG
jgi:glutamine amidotransferase